MRRTIGLGAVALGVIGALATAATAGNFGAFQANLTGASAVPGPVDTAALGCVPRSVDFRRSFRADELNSIFDQPIRTVPPCDA